MNLPAVKGIQQGIIRIWEPHVADQIKRADLKTYRNLRKFLGITRYGPFRTVSQYEKAFMNYYQKIEEQYASRTTWPEDRTDSAK